MLVRTHTKKRQALGQNFLIDSIVANFIAETTLHEAVQRGCHALLEIGPGKGAVTFPLLKILNQSQGVPIQRFLLCEIDHQLAYFWKSGQYSQSLSSQSPPFPLLQVEEADFLNLPETQWLQITPLAVVSNLPYSSGTAILKRLAAHPQKIALMVLMFQSEFAQRLRAEPGNRRCGSLSIWFQNRWSVKKLCSVPSQAFRPVPQVHSEVLLLTPLPQEQIFIGPNPQDQLLWEKLLRVCFLHRRKMLRTALAYSDGYKNALAQAGVDGTRRAESLTWEEWKRFYEALNRPLS